MMIALKNMQLNVIRRFVMSDLKLFIENLKNNLKILKSSIIYSKSLRGSLNFKREYEKIRWSIRHSR